MFCKNCGASMPDNVSFCTNCGAKLEANQAQTNAQQIQTNAQQNFNQQHTQQNFNQQQAQQNFSQQQAQQNFNRQQTYVQPNYVQPGEETISTGKWFGYQLIPFIPFVGGIIYLVMLFVWGFGSGKPATFRNWAKSQLIMILIVVVLAIILFIVFTALGVSLFNSFRNSSQFNW